MTRRRWSATRVLVAGGALALVVAASGEGCEEGGSRSSEEVDCPGVGEMLSVAAAWLPQEELAEDLEYAKQVAERVANARDGTCERSTRGLGYKITIRHTRAHDIHVRVMARGGGRQNYYRVIVTDTGAAERDGRITNNPATTHHPLSGFSFSDVNDILDIIDKIKGRRQ